MRSMVEGAAAKTPLARRPSTALRAVPLPERGLGED